MRRFYESVRDRVKKPRPEPDVPLPPPPLLPLERPRPITPPATSASAEVAHLGLFARLPAELRQQILAEAFGKRELHLDLRLVPRGWRPVHLRTGDTAHGRGSAPWSGQLPRHTPRDKLEWRWYSCVCHRQAPWARNPRDSAVWNWPHKDMCLVGGPALCELYPPPSGMPAGPCDYVVGALGWLRTCRQAYLEGAQVLYGTNTFILESEELLDLLLDPIHTGSGHVLLPQHLSLIKSLEVRIDTMLFQATGMNYADLELNSNWNGRRSRPHLAALATTFPGVQSLVISFTEWLYTDYKTRPKDRLPELRDVLLQPLADALASLACTRRGPLIVELPRGVFSDLDELGALAREEPENERAEGRRWLRYPITPHSSGSRDLATTYDDREPFYYIKEGPETGLDWNVEGRPRWAGHHGHRVDRPP
ncbi:hypothetical protein Micbo1qcDRAFT_208213 [Microdochium bolleyi]|uniref:Uncharacterized protein n=1 Tax=Microdochium bolleyi TaxID=196109 RepID=A0A136IRZ3_9PEZI|nr:hypothetical protein Micbo1qcDRAFT_208213 [Microdochium bolleyi]